jgi:small subunit ribosomal protein S21e
METLRLFKETTEMKGSLRDDGTCTDLYLPRKCMYSGKIIDSKDKSSVQLSLAPLSKGTVDLNGERHQVIIGGFVRGKGQGDYALEKVLKDRNLYPVP